MQTKDKIREMVLHVASLFDKYEIKYWLDFGTLLGAIRENDIIDWDEDGDISIFESSRELALEVLQKECQYLVDIRNGRIKIFWDCITVPWIDIYVWKDTPVNGLHKNIEGGFLNGLAIKAEHVGNFDRIMFHDHSILVLQYSVDRLIQLYGDYKTPVRKVPYWT